MSNWLTFDDCDLDITVDWVRFMIYNFSWLHGL